MLPNQAGGWGAGAPQLVQSRVHPPRAPTSRRAVVVVDARVLDGYTHESTKHDGCSGRSYEASEAPLTMMRC